VITAASALAAIIPLDVPVGWGGDQDTDVNMFHALLLLGGIPLLLFIAITVAVYVPSLVRDRTRPAADREPVAGRATHRHRRAEGPRVRRHRSRWREWPLVTVPTG
jgi:hypothetical protein